MYAHGPTHHAAAVSGMKKHLFVGHISTIHAITVRGS